MLSCRSQVPALVFSFLAGDKKVEKNDREKEGGREIRMPGSYEWRERERPFYT